MLDTILYALLPVAAILLGGGVGIVTKPGGGFTSMVLHFAAGVVFSVVAVELLPDIVNQHAPLEVGIGFGLGIGTMLAVKFFVEKLEEKDNQESSKLPMGLLVAMGVDLAIDGLLLGVGFAAGDKEGILLSIALAFEVFSLGLAVALACRKNNVPSRKILLVALLLGITFFVGAILGISLLAHLSQEMLELVLSFGLAALLFLVTEELLVEAHEEKETPFQTGCFFAGFLLFLIIGMVS